MIQDEAKIPGTRLGQFADIRTKVRAGARRASRMLQGGADNAERGSARKTRGLAACTSIAC